MANNRAGISPILVGYSQILAIVGDIVRVKFSACLDSAIGGVYERAGVIRTNDGSTGSLTMIGMVSPADLLTIARAREEAYPAIYEGSAEIITVRRKESNI